MGKVSRSMYMDAPPDQVFKYYSRPEHIAGTFPENSKMKVVPIKVTEGWGVGTVFRILGDFGGKKMQWDNLTCEVEANRKIVSKSINGPFKKNEITVTFEPKNGGTEVNFEADYLLPYWIIGKAIDKFRLRKDVVAGIEMSLDRVRDLILEKKDVAVEQKITA